MAMPFGSKHPVPYGICESVEELKAPPLKQVFKGAPRSNSNPTQKVVAANQDETAIGGETRQNRIERAAHLMKVAVNNGRKPRIPPLELLKFG